MVARHSISIGLVTRFPAMAPASTHFLGGRALRRVLLLHITVSRHGIGIGLVTRFPATAPASTHFLGGRALRLALLLHITVARHGIGIGLVTRFPATAPGTSHFLGGRGICSPATTTSTSSTSSTPRPRATASASALLPGSLLRHQSHTSLAIARSGVCCHSTFPMDATSALFKLNDITTDFSELIRQQRVPFIFTVFSCCLRRARFVFQFQFPWCAYFFWRIGKMGAPRGWYGKEERI